MTKAQLVTSTRALVNEVATDSGALLSDAGNLLDFMNDAAEQVVLDLIPVMPTQFLTTENVSLVASTANYTLTTPFWMIYKVERNVSASAPIEIEVINALELRHYLATVGATSAAPEACYFMGDTLYFVPTPSVNVSNYAKVYLVRPELATVPTDGPTYIPSPAHRLIAYKAAKLCATLLEADGTRFEELYQSRLASVKTLWKSRFHQEFQVRK